MRVVFDTNVYIAAVLRGGFAEDIIALADKKVVTLLTSRDILKELENKLLTKFSFTQDQVKVIRKRIQSFSEVIMITEKITQVARDPEDNKILECAIAGKADIIVSSDQDLIQLKTYKDIPIIHPKTLSYTFPHYFTSKKK